MERINRNRYLATAILATILIFSMMVQFDMIPMVSSDIPVPPEASMTMFDSSEDLVHIYTGEPAEMYFDFVDVELVSLELSAESAELGCTITIREGPPAGLSKTVHCILTFDENDDLEDNSMNFPFNGTDTMYTVIYTPEGWSIERAKYQVLGDWWMVEDTEASFATASSMPGGFSIDIFIPLVELPGLTEILPWKVITQTFTYPLTFPETGDFVPNEGLAYLGPKPGIVVTNLVWGPIATSPTQTVTGYVSDPTISEISYNVTSMLHEENGTVPVLEGGFSFDINLTEGHNTVTISDGINEEALIFELDTSAPLVTFLAGSYFNWMNSSRDFDPGRHPFPKPPFDYDTWDEGEEYYGKDAGLSWGYLKSKTRNYYKDGKKVGDEHTEFEYYEVGPLRGKVKKKTTTYTDKDGNPIASREGGTTEYKYNEKGELIEEVFTPTDPKQLTRKYTYERDQQGRITRIIEEYGREGKSLGKAVTGEFKRDGQGRVTGYTIEDFGRHGESIYKVMIELEYENGKLKKRTLTYPSPTITEWFEWIYEYDEEGRLTKIIKREVIKLPDGSKEETEVETTTIEYSNGKAKITKTHHSVVRIERVSEYRYENNFPNFTESTTLPGRILISDGSSNPMIPHFGIHTVITSTVNSTGNYYDTFLITGNSFDFNVTLSMNTTITITVIDEAGNIGINTIRIPQPLVSDIDCNNKVNIIDISTAAIAFGTQPGDERWNFFADVNNDDVVNILDISTVALDFGKSY